VVLTGERGAAGIISLASRTAICRTITCADVRSILVVADLLTTGVADLLSLLDESPLNQVDRGLTGSSAQKITSRCLEIVIGMSGEGHLLIGNQWKKR